MSTTVLYFIPTSSADTSPLPEVIRRLTIRCNPSILPNWTLRQRLFRSTPVQSAEPTANKPFEPRYLQIISFSGHPQHSYIVISATEGSVTVENSTAAPDATVISIPSGASTDEFNQLLLTKLGPLWQPRQLLAVVDGLAYQVGAFRMRVGEVRQGIGGSQLVRGVAIEIAVEEQGDGELEDRGSTEKMITTFWAELGLTGGKEFLQTHPDKGEDNFQDVRLWSRMLMLKS
ncbi:MAG: hypothetical protein Q9218_002158 [Villophora microphyllina]